MTSSCFVFKFPRRRSVDGNTFDAFPDWNLRFKIYPAQHGFQAFSPLPATCGGRRDDVASGEVWIWLTTFQSPSQGLRSPWSAVEKLELWEQPFWNNKGHNRILPIRFHCAVCIYGARLKWLLPELSFSYRWSRGTKTLGTRVMTFSKGTETHNIRHSFLGDPRGV